MRANRIAALRRTGANETRELRGFTLIELLVVIALTAILLTVVFRPLISSIALANRAATQTESQAAARDTDGLVNSALSLAEYVLDPAATTLNIWLTDRLGNEYPLASMYTMMEYVPPAHQLDQNPLLAGGQPLPLDPTTGLPSYNYPGVTSAQSGLAFPLATGGMLGRIFLGLVNNASGPGIGGTNGAPINPYFNFYEWANTSGSDPNKPLNKGLGNNNTITLYKAEVTTSIPDPNNPGAFIPNLKLFHTGPNAAMLPDTKTGALIVHDPNFFYDNSLAGGNEAGAGTTKWAVPGWKDLNGDGKVEIWENWRAVSTSLVRPDKVDLLAFQRDPQTNGINYDAANHPIVSALATFKPDFLQNDPGVPTNLEQAGNEVPNTISPNFTSRFDNWTYNYRVLVYRDNGSGVDPTQRNPLDLFVGVSNSAGAFKIVHIDPTMGIAPGMPLPNLNPLPDVSPDVMNNIFTNPNTQFGFAVSTNKGLISFGYPSTEVIHDALGNPLAQRYSPDDINNAYAAFGALGPGARRFLSLTTLSTNTWGGTQLNPAGVVSPLAPGSGLQTPSITPGSELVFGPDQRPGIHYGNRIQYTRVSAAAGFTGPNQYKINFTNNSNIPGGIGGGTPPSLIAGYMEFDSVPDGTQYNAGTMTVNGGTDPSTGQPAAGPHMLPIFRFNPVTMSVDGTLPAAPVEVYYNFQMNQATDVIKIDYMTRKLMTFTLEMRLYDQASGKPQITRLTDNIKVRNLQH